MNQNADGYPQDYYENVYYDDQLYDYQEDCGDVSALQPPNARLYPEGLQNISTVYPSRNQYYEHYGTPSEAPVIGSCRRATSPSIPSEYYYDYSNAAYPLYESPTFQQPSHPRCAPQITKPKSAFSQPRGSTFADSVQNACVYHENTSPYSFQQQAYEDYYEKYEDKNHTYKMHQNKCVLHQKYKRGCNDSEWMDGKEVKWTNSKGGRAARKKYPVTVKMPKYVANPSAKVNKKASVLCVPVFTQPDPSLFRKKSKTNQQPRGNRPQTRPFQCNVYDQGYSYSAHKMNSEGDVKGEMTEEVLDTFLDNYEKHIIGPDQEDVNVKEFAKFLKPKVPSSVKLKQDQVADMKSRSLQPKMKMSLDRLLNRLQKCEDIESLEGQSEASCKTTSSKKKNPCNNLINAEAEKNESFNYDSLARKCSLAKEDSTSKKEERPGTAPADRSQEQVKSLFEPLKSKRSGKTVHAMDDHCALDLHKSKSYIVDLIDRALSRELGTVPREQSAYPDMTPNQAIATIGRLQQRPEQKELCYEVAAALTDSIVSNASAPPKEEYGPLVERETEKEVELKSSEEIYIKQLKQLRWGHIRHIQHEARKLADLEEFLEKCGEADYL